MECWSQKKMPSMHEREARKPAKEIANGRVIGKRRKRNPVLSVFLLFSLSLFFLSRATRKGRRLSRVGEERIKKNRNESESKSCSRQASERKSGSVGP